MAGMIIPSVIKSGQLIVRGSKEWDDRELYRRLAGNQCLSFGTIDSSNLTIGKSALGIGKSLWSESSWGV